jgi:hypothetical protein
MSAGETDFVNMQEYAEDRIEVLKLFLPFKEGIPSHDTLRRIMSMIDPEEFKTVFHEFCLEYRKIKIEHSTSEENHHVLAMDGKEGRYAATCEKTSLIKLPSPFNKS